MGELGDWAERGGPTDEELVAAFRRGDRGAAEAIAERCRPVIRATCRRYLSSLPSDVDDACQEALLRVYRGLRVQRDDLRLSAWVRRIAANCAIDVLRRRSRLAEVLAEPEAVTLLIDLNGTVDGPESALLAEAQGAEVRRVLQALPPSYARALAMRAEERSHVAIAEDLATTPDRVKALLHRARGSFREAWARLAAVPIIGWAVTRRWAASVPINDTASVAAMQAAPQVAPVVAAAAPFAERAAGAAAVLVFATASVGVGITAQQPSGPAPRITSLARPSDLPPPPPTDSPSVQVTASNLEKPAVDSEPSQPDDAAPGEESHRPSPEASASEPPTGESSEHSSPPPSESPRPAPSSPGSSPSPSSPPAQPAAPPPFDFAMTIGGDATGPCECDPRPRVDRQQLAGGMSSRLDVRHVSQGGATDRDGELGWGAWLDLNGHIHAGGGALAFDLALHQASQGFDYRGSLSVSSARRYDEGWIVTVAGHYDAVERRAGAPLPTSGAISGTVIVWGDGDAIIDVDLRLK